MSIERATRLYNLTRSRAKAKPLIKNCPDGHYPEKQRSELGTVNGLANAPNVGFAFGVPASAWASPAAALRIIGEKQRDVGLTRSDPRGRRGTSRRDGGARVGLRGLLGKGVMGSAHYDNGSGDCEAAHRVIIGLTFAFGEEPLRHISTPEEAGVERAWLGMVDPVLDCNGWMLDDTTLLPKFKFGRPRPAGPEPNPPWQRGLPRRRALRHRPLWPRLSARTTELRPSRLARSQPGAHQGPGPAVRWAMEHRDLPCSVSLGLTMTTANPFLPFSRSSKLALDCPVVWSYRSACSRRSVRFFR